VIFSDDFNRSELQEAKDEVGNGWSTNSGSRAKGNKQVDLKDGAMHIVMHKEADHAVSVKHDGAMVNQYAQRILSTPGKQDGLAWQGPDGTWAGPVGEGIARVIAEGYRDRYDPYHGYYFKVLKGQGPAAPLGTMDYVIKGSMIGGFALAASPSDYAVTGVKSFIVSQDGVVYERDFGDDTADWFKSAVVFNPDPKWKPVQDAE